MLSDETIVDHLALLEPLIGRTKAAWYADACKLEYGEEPGRLLWGCRYREMAWEAGELAELVRLLARACQGGFSQLTEKQQFLLKELMKGTADAQT